MVDAGRLEILKTGDKQLTGSTPVPATKIKISIEVMSYCMTSDKELDSTLLEIGSLVVKALELYAKYGGSNPLLSPNKMIQNDTTTH